MRRLISSGSSSSGVFDVIRPSTDGLAGGEVAQRLEAAGALAVELQEEGVDVHPAEHQLGDRLVAAARHPAAAEVAAAHVRRDEQVVGLAGDDLVGRVPVLPQQFVGIVAAGGDLVAEVRVAEVGEADVVELEVAAAGFVEGGDLVAVAGHEVGPELPPCPGTSPRRPRCARPSAWRRRDPASSASGCAWWRRTPETRRRRRRSDGQCRTGPVITGIGGLSPSPLKFAGRGRAASSTPSKAWKKSRCHQSRRNSPSVTAPMPILLERATTAAISSSSIDPQLVGGELAVLPCLASRGEPWRPQQAADHVGAMREVCHRQLPTAAWRRRRPSASSAPSSTW